ncbi:hypothetical protein PI23P_09525 [Polaribacter irgensii 23-P]|uniref:Uncharacterized protein n=1 Tax=Polaribacter irgensii 23-P TaxID=313594 RepID=A4C0B4_9FLAO|nr:hypothetical protein PI23P_09525 [Polaribacter irgensii 23-P]
MVKKSIGFVLGSIFFAVVFGVA